MISIPHLPTHSNYLTPERPSKGISLLLNRESCWFRLLDLYPARWKGKGGNMPKYGRGLNREIVAAVNSGIVSEPFTVDDVRIVIKKNGWQPEPTENYVAVTLANAASDEHSDTYKKYFRSLGEGKYRLRNEFKGREYR